MPHHVSTTSTQCTMHEHAAAAAAESWSVSCKKHAQPECISIRVCLFAGFSMRQCIRLLPGHSSCGLVLLAVAFPIFLLVPIHCKPNCLVTDPDCHGCSPFLSACKCHADEPQSSREHGAHQKQQQAAHGNLSVGWPETVVWGEGGTAGALSTDKQLLSAEVSIVLAAPVSAGKKMFLWLEPNAV